MASDDPDELRLEHAEARVEPGRVGDLAEQIAWRMQYGEFGTPLGLKIIGWIIIALLGLILWRIW